MKKAIEYNGKGNTFIKVYLLSKATKSNYEGDVIKMDIKSVTTRLSGVMTEEEAIILANGLINAVTIKMHKEKRI